MGSRLGRYPWLANIFPTMFFHFHTFLLNTLFFTLYFLYAFILTSFQRIECLFFLLRRPTRTKGMLLGKSAQKDREQEKLHI